MNANEDTDYGSILNGKTDTPNSEGQHTEPRLSTQAGFVLYLRIQRIPRFTRKSVGKSTLHRVRYQHPRQRGHSICLSDSSPTCFMTQPALVLTYSTRAS